MKGPPQKKKRKRKLYALGQGFGVYICQIWAKHVIHTQTQNVYVYTNEIPFINEIVTLTLLA